MAQSLRQVKSRIKGVEGIKKITRAMEMVSASKLRPLQKALFVSREYNLRIERIVDNLLSSFGGIHDELLIPAKEVKSVLLCPVTSDTGLCAGYNANIFQAAQEFIRKNSSSQVSLLVVGRKGLNYFKKKGFNIIGERTELFGHYSNDLADGITKELISAFVSGKADEVHISYAKNISASRVDFVTEKILNIEPAAGEKIEYLVEPKAPALIKELLPLYVKTKIRNIILNAFTAENSTRVMAMHEATTNAGELLDNLVIQRNKMRQADITRDLIEVISSATALKG